MAYHLIENEDLKARLKKCVRKRNQENIYADEIRKIFKEKTSPEIPNLLKSAIDQLTGGLGLIDLAEISLEEILEGWCGMMEERHPDLKSDA